MSLWRLRYSSKLSPLELGLVKLSETVDFWVFKWFFRPVKFRFISSSQVFVIFICKDFFKKKPGMMSLLNFLYLRRGVETSSIIPKNPCVRGVYHGWKRISKHIEGNPYWENISNRWRNPWRRSLFLEKKIKGQRVSLYLIFFLRSWRELVEGELLYLENILRGWEELLSTLILIKKNLKGHREI